ncbi:hypothetical protein [Pseudoalteromonas umbrosa]|uniref:hypothetical protein n=1 Tax=Pseudoalteromonas umbrosa TaxID=3048489 RepID=UPI0024C3C348|nr:hypothetical protein [Pseudoalteromonas sp. B95]MDK1286320.1 hypothetical protein [Pseudoalteromonas sp. B95]
MWLESDKNCSQKKWSDVPFLSSPIVDPTLYKILSNLDSLLNAATKSNVETNLKKEKILSFKKHPIISIGVERDKTDYYYKINVGNDTCNQLTVYTLINEDFFEVKSVYMVMC